MAARKGVASAKIASFLLPKTIALVTSSSQVGRIRRTVITFRSTLSLLYEAYWMRVATLGSPAGATVTPTNTNSGEGALAMTWLSDLTVEPTAYEGTSPHWYRAKPTLAGYDVSGAGPLEILSGESWGLVVPASIGSVADLVWEADYEED